MRFDDEVIEPGEVNSLGYRLDPVRVLYSPEPMRTWWAVGGAVIGAAGSYLGAKESNKPRNSWTDQTTTQTPYREDLYWSDIEAVLNMQRDMVNRGPVQVGRNGELIYTANPGAAPNPTERRDQQLDRARQELADWQAGGGRRTGGGPGDRDIPGHEDPGGPEFGPGSGAHLGGAGFTKSGTATGTGGTGGARSAGNTRAPETWTNARGETMTRNAQGKAVKATGANAPRPTTGGGLTAPGPNLSTPQGIFSEVARRGLDAGNTATQNQARGVMANIWGDAAGEGGSAAGGERTGFEGYNPILDRLTGTLEGDVEDRVGRDLLLEFLNENNRGGGGGARPGAVGPGGTAGTGSGPLTTANVGGGIPPWHPNYPGNQGGPGTGYTGGVPDTMAADSFFGTQTRRMFDEQANDAELQALIDSMNEDTERGMFRDLAQLDASAQGTGRFGGGLFAGLSRDAREEALQEMNKTSSQVRIGDREARRNALLNALNQVNTRDLGLLGANVQREGIAAGERSSAAASAAAAGAQADQIALARRGQDLSALGALMDNERFSLGQLGDVGGQLSGDRLASLGMVPGLEGIGLSGINAALGAGGGLTDLRGQDIQRQIAGQQAGIARQGLDFQRGVFNAGQQQGQVNDYLRTIMGISGLGGTSRTQGQNVMPGLGVSPTGAALMGGLGGASTGYGIGQQWRG